MKNTLIAIIASIVSLVNPALAGTASVEKVSIVNSSLTGVTAKVFAATVIQDSDTYTLGGGLSLEVEVLQNLSLEVVGSLFEDEVYSAGLNAIYYIPVTEVFSVYALGGGSYGFETEQWTLSAGAGVKYSLSSQLSLFVDGVYNFAEEDGSGDEAVVARIGVGFSF